MKHKTKQPRLLKFENYSPDEKRVRIAKDVIAGLKSERLYPKIGMWVGGFEHKDLKNQEESFRDVLARNAHCQVCGIGALFISAVERYDGLKVGELWLCESTSEIIIFLRQRLLGWFDFKEYLLKYFSLKQLSLIQFAFEGTQGMDINKNYPTTYTYLEQQKALEFGRQYEDSKDRMMAIMQNIVRNKGTFRP